MITDTNYREQIEQKLRETEFFVRSSHFEYFTHWQHYHEKIDWKDESVTYTFRIGEVADRPVDLALHWALLNGKLVCFWHFMSQLQDLEMAKNYLEQYQPKWDNGRLAHTDAWNFHHCYHYVKG